MAAKKAKANSLPYNPDAERAVLGSALLNKDALLDVTSTLMEDDFFESKHQLIFRAINRVHAKDTPVDMLTVTEELMNMKEYENIGGVEYLKECADAMVALSALKYYMDIVYDQSVLRKMLISLRNIDERYKTEEIKDVNDFILSAENEFKGAIEKRRISSFESTADIAPKVQEKLNNMKTEGNEEVTGLDTGYRKLNALTQGFQRGEMIIVAARPSVGKTALALNFARNVSSRGTAVAIFSLEMSKDLLFRRLIAAASCVSLKNINTGHMSGKEKMDLSLGIKKITDSPIYIDDSSGIRLGDIVNKSHKLQAHVPNLGLIIVDYLGLVTTGSNNKNPDSRQEEVRKISLAMKGLAKDLDVPVVVISQLSRDVEKRDSKRPMLSDLRDSGSIEQDADVVMLLYRGDYYDKKVVGAANGKKGSELSNEEKFELAKAKREKELGEQLAGSASYVEVNVAKNRNGQVGKCGLFFYKEYGRFDNPTPEWEEAMREITESQD